MKKILVLLAFAAVATTANVFAQVVNDDDEASMNAENRCSYSHQEDEDDEAGM